MSESDEEQKPRASLETDSPTRGEPEGLATRGTPTERSSEFETKELRGLAKQWDAQDKAAKDKARPKLGMRRSLVEHVPAPVEVTSPHQPPLQPQRRSPSEEKLRSTYLQTGMKPGAYPGRGPEGSSIEQLEQRLISRQYDTRLSSDNLDSDNKTTEPDIDVGPEPEPSQGEPDIDLEQGHSELQHEGPLIEAFVVPDEEAERSFMPPVKAGTAGPPLIDGDHYEKPKPVRDESSSGLGLSKHALLLIASLIGCFLIGAVLVVVVVLLVVSPGGGGENDVFSDSAIGAAPTGTPVPTAAPILPEINTMPPVIDISPGDTPTEDPFPTIPAEPEEDPETGFPSFQPSRAPSFSPTAEPLPSATPSMGPTVPVGTPTDPPSAEPTIAPTTSPTEAPTPKPTTSPPTREPTRSPTPRPTDPPTPRPTDPPTPRPTDPPTPAPTRSPTRSPTDPPTRKPTIAPTEAIVTTPSPQSTTLPPLDSKTTARVIFDVNYTINRSNLDPSQEEIDTLDAMLEADFAEALASQVSYQDDILLKSEHKATEAGWNQKIWVDFVFGQGNLPPITTVQTGLSSFSVSEFMGKAKSVGPSFASITRMSWGLSIPVYG